MTSSCSGTALGSTERWKATYFFSPRTPASPARVKGDVIAFAQSLHITGHVDGNVRSFTNNITISGDVTRNALTFAESANLDGAGKIGGSMTSFVKTLSLDGTLGRDLLYFRRTHGDLRKNRRRNSRQGKIAGHRLDRAG